MKHLFKWGANFKVKDGLNCRFWQDCWALNVPLKVANADLFSMVRDPDTVVADHWVEEEWSVDFRRSLSLSGSMRDG